ncbi:MAG: PEP-CTERM sorting domain-containing protein [Gemmatimonadaceae bacterium]|nr:PEP-CTERM sorting domain-containing protein [Gemmatimonadaceae bacterium]
MAAQSCTAGSFASYAVAGFSCQHGGLTFGGFTLVDVAPGLAGNTVPAIGDLLVTPTSSAGGWVGFAFGPAISASGGALGVGLSSSNYFGINVNVALPIGTQLRSTWTDPTATATGGLRSVLVSAAITYTQQCYTSLQGAGSSNYWDVIGAGAFGPAAVTGTNTSAQPGQLGTASMSSYGFEVLVPGTTTVPEPTSLALLTAALLALPLARRRRTPVR